MVHQRRGQRAALVRIGAGADFVEQHQRRQIQRPIHGHQIGDVRRERAEAGGNRLLVTDVREHRAEHRQPRGHRRDVQAGLGHQREQPGGLQGDGLAPGIRAGDEEHAAGRFQHDVDRDGFLEQRMPRPPQFEGSIGDEHWLDAAEACGVSRPRLQHVQLGGDRFHRAQVARPAAEAVRQFQQDAEDLFPLALFELDDVVVDFDRGGRLQEQAGAAARAAVHDARDVAPVFGAHQQHVAAVPLGDHFVLQVLRRVLAARELFERLAQLLPQVPQAIADAAERGAGVVEHLARDVDGLADRRHLGLEAGQLADDRVQERKRTLRGLDAGARPLHRVHELGQRPQRQRIQRASLDAERGQRLDESLPGAQREGGILLEEPHRLAGAVLQRRHVAEFGGRLRHLQPRPAERRQRQPGDVSDDAIEFKGSECQHQKRPR